jgi:hypothetical protein
MFLLNGLLAADGTGSDGSSEKTVATSKESRN